MFSLQKLLGKKNTFFTLLESSAQEADKCAKLLNLFLADASSLDILNQLKAARQRNKEIAEEISELVVNTFVTALEREDIEALANALYKVPKPIEKFAERFHIANKFISDVNFQAQSQIISRATEIVLDMVRQIKDNNSLELVRSLNSKLQEAETEADELENELLLGLYSQRTNSLRVIIIKDLYDFLEKAVDRCRDVGTVITHVALKNA